MEEIAERLYIGGIRIEQQKVNVRIFYTPAYIYMIICDSRLDVVITPTKTV